MIPASQRIKLWDLETEPAPLDYLERIMPEFDAPGNYKDPAKIEAYKREKREKWIEQAALDPTTGRILSTATQWLDEPDSFAIWDHQTVMVSTQGQEYLADEKQLIRWCFEDMQAAHMGAAYKMVGFCTHSFDLRFLVLRALALGVPVPSWLMPNGQAYWKPPPWLIDLRLIWTFGDRAGSGSLEDVSVFLGGPAKIGKGADYARLWHNPETREQAYEYQRSEMAALTIVANKLLPYHEVSENQPGREES